MTKERMPRRGRSDQSGAEAMDFAVEAARIAHDDKCENVVLLDVRGLSQVTKFIVVASGTSDRQMASVLEHILAHAKGTGHGAFGRSSDEGRTWMLADFVDVVVHLFEPNTRAHYDLEMLWGDAKRVAWERPDQVNRDHAGVTGARDEQR